MIYLVFSYVDPDELRRGQQRDIVQKLIELTKENSTPASSEHRNMSHTSATRTYRKLPHLRMLSSLDITILICVIASGTMRPQALVCMAQAKIIAIPNVRVIFSAFRICYKQSNLISEVCEGLMNQSQGFFSRKYQDFDILYLTGGQPYL
jgi:hypothetical protein